MRDILQLNRIISSGCPAKFDKKYRVIQKKLCTFLKHRHFFQEVRRDLKFLHDLDKCWEGLRKKFQLSNTFTSQITEMLLRTLKKRVITQ